MKKMILAAAIIAASATTAVAQDTFTPAAGDFSTEIQFNPFSDNFSTFKQGDLGLSFRYFLTGKDAIRLNLGFGIDKDVNNTDQATAWDNDGEPYEWITLHNNTRHTNFNINLGYERHFVTKGRIDLYAGAQIGVGFDSYGNNSESYNATDKVVEKYWTNYYTNNDGKYCVGSTNVNFGLFTGIDFYVYKSLYVGAELGLNLKYNSLHNEVAKKNGEEVNKNAHKDPTGKVISFGTHVEPALRLGWTF